jgi:hypothetical protein
MSILDEKWTDFYDDHAHTNVRTEDHYVFTSGSDWLRKYIIDLHNAKLEGRPEMCDAELARRLDMH